MIDNKTLANKILLAAITGLSLTLSACVGNTSMFRSDASHTAVYPASGPTRLDKLDWKFSAPDKIYS
ncbi:MAG: hypothetical protein RQ982_05090 [Gammaproteobacteria bacterium]|nr:hypothetical protein [Gammaproteobacteria bacterium]